MKNILFEFGKYYTKGVAITTQVETTSLLRSINSSGKTLLKSPPPHKNKQCP